MNFKKLTIGRDFGNAVEVLDGIDAADRIVINPPDALEQDEQVNVATPEPQGAAAPSAAKH